MSCSFRVGFGFDVHPLKEGRKLILGGVEIPFHKGCDGHSDADVLLHALCDALLGAAGLRDIGYYFPNTDPQYKNISSMLLLKKVYDKISSAGFLFGNADITVILEEPKLSPYIENIKQNIASVLQTSTETLSIKATTNEQLGYIGKGLGINAYAVVLIYRHP